MRRLFERLGLAKRSKPEGVYSIVQAYGEVLKSSGSVVRDIHQLPASKDEIKAALLSVITSTQHEALRHELRAAYVNLGSFQDFAEIRRSGANADSVVMEENIALVRDLKAFEAGFGGR